jgi:hypothetical protein
MNQHFLEFHHVIRPQFKVFEPLKVWDRIQIWCFLLILVEVLCYFISTYFSCHIGYVQFHVCNVPKFVYFPPPPLFVSASLLYIISHKLSDEFNIFTNVFCCSFEGVLNLYFKASCYLVSSLFFLLLDCRQSNMFYLPF